jgi:small-conductance mechanosensitive channel
METVQWIVTAVLGLTFLGDIVLHFVLPSRKRKDYAETELAEHDADKAEVERLHMMIDHQQKSLDKYLDIEKDNAERIAEQNRSLDSKTEQIRKLTDQLIESEHGRNEDKEEIALLNKENGDLRVENEYLKMWICKRTDCQDPRGGRPPREKLKGLKYEPPKRAVKE